MDQGRSSQPPVPAGPPVETDAGRFELLFRHSPAPMCLSVAETGRCLEANDAWLETTGFSREELLGRTLPEVGLVPAQAWGGLLDKLKGQPGRLRGETLELTPKAGASRICVAGFELLTGAGAGELLVTLKDITILRRQADHLQRLARLYACLSQVNQAIIRSETQEALLDKICEVLVVIGPFKMAWIGWVDPGTAEVRIVSRYGDTEGYLAHVRVRCDDSPLGRGGTGRAIRTGCPVVINDFLDSTLASPWHALASGSGLAASVSLPIRLGKEVVGALMVYASTKDFFGPDELNLLEEAAGDVSFALEHLSLDARRRDAEEALLASERRLRTFIEEAPVAIAVTRDLLTQYVNRAFRELLKETGAASPAGAPILGFIAPEGREAILARVRLRAQGVPVTPEFDTMALGSDGRTLPIHVAVAVIPFAQGPETLFFISDLTERVRSEAQRAHLQAQLQQTQKMDSLGSLAGGIAHDMNNVLGAILGLASAHLALETGDSQTCRTFRTISEAATRGGRMVKGLLNFVRQSPGEHVRLDLNALLLEEARLLERTTLAKVRLDLALAPGLRPIQGDGNALAHAFMNLCVNAVDAMADGGNLTLRTRNAGEDEVEIVVEDTGCGMAASVLDRALDPFFTTKEVGKGTGLGLSMVYSTVRAHEGRMELQSEPGQGTRVTIRFPASPHAALPPAPAEGPGPEGPGAHLDVLLVDDDDLVQCSTRLLAEVLGHAVTCAGTGEEALSLLEAGAPADVVILDLNMPGLGGQGTLPRLRALRPDLPVLLATGRPDQEAMDLAEAYARVTLLPKPYSLEELQGCLLGLSASNAGR